MEGHGGGRAVAGVRLDGLPDDGVVGVTGREGLDPVGPRERGPHRLHDDDAAAHVQAQLLQAGEERAGPLTGDVTLDQVTRRLQAGSGLHGDVRGRLTSEQVALHPFGEVGRDREPEVDEHVGQPMIGTPTAGPDEPPPDGSEARGRASDVTDERPRSPR